MNDATLRELAEVADACWPAAERLVVDGWTLRCSAGIFRRINSAWPRLAGAAPLEEKIEAARAFYRARGRRPRIQIGALPQPADLEARLDDRGWIREAPTLTRVAPLSEALGRLETRPAALAPLADDAWMDACWPMGGARRAAGAAVIGRLTRPARFAWRGDPAAPEAVGMAVLDGPWLGIFGMRTRPDARRRGHARSVLRALLGWGARGGAETAWLQVEEDNPPARSLYGSVGFVTAYGYHYRTAPAP